MQTLLNIIIFLLAFVGGTVIIYVITYRKKINHLSVKVDIILDMFSKDVLDKSLEKFNTIYLETAKDKAYLENNKLYLPRPTSSNDTYTFLSEAVLIITLLCFQEMGICKIDYKKD